MSRPYESFTAEEKVKIIREVFGDRAPDYQWYELNKQAVVNKGDVLAVSDTTDLFGNFEIHGSRAPSGRALRLRWAKKVVTEIPQILPNGEKVSAPLYQAVNDYMFPKDGWVDFLEGVLISADNSHGKIAEKYGLDFVHFTDYFDLEEKIIRRSKEYTEEKKQELLEQLALVRGFAKST